MDEPVPVRLVKRLVARPPRHDPEPGLEADGANLVGHGLHPLRELLFVAAEIEVVKVGDGQDV